MSEILAHRALQQGMTALPILLNDLESPRLRDTMCEVSLLAGLAISQTRTSLCHAISYPLTAHFGVPHGMACAFTMPAVLRHNLSADDGRFKRLAKVVSQQASDSAEELIRLFDELNQQLRVAEQVREMVGSLDSLVTKRKEMLIPARANNALVNADDTSLQTILERAWES